VKKKEDSRTRRRVGSVAGAAAVLALALAACTAPAEQPLRQVDVPNFGKVSGGDVTGLNYSTDLVYTFGFEGPKYSGISGGGGPIHEFSRSGRVGEAGVSCCATLPDTWQPALRLTMHWLAYQDEGNNVVKRWYKAENVQIPQYDGKQADVLWAIFLPGNRVKLMVADGNANGHNSVAARPADNDPYIAQGVRDTEFEQQLQENNR